MGNIYYKNLFKYILGFKNSIDTAECEEISKISLPITVVTNESFSHVSVNSPNASYKKASRITSYNVCYTKLLRAEDLGQVL